MATDGLSRFGVALYGPQREIPDDFAGVDAPKLKFNFTLSLKLTGMMQGVTTGNDDPYLIDFGVKQITRPAPNVIFEDVNYYNYMTKVATRVEFGVVTVTLYDDRNNRAHQIFEKYMNSVSPITNVGRDSAPILGSLSKSQTSSIGPLKHEARHGPIQSIRVTQFINSRGSTVAYDYINPKVQNVILDELDMGQSDVNTITFTFVYDTYNVVHSEGSPPSSDPQREQTESEIKRSYYNMVEAENMRIAGINELSNTFDNPTRDDALRRAGIDPTIFGR